ncbi:MAG TPA: hypothetical protein DD435_16935, partial [Cyanobacteria bacterium UBA8530]|nr:hypothetical protein [Cyanobacteria bacterium UBA8530]
MKKNLRFLNLLLLFLTLLIGVVLSAGGLLFVTHKDALIKEVRVQIEQNASRAIGLPIQVGKIGGNLLNGIEAENISIGSSKKRGAPPFAHIPRLTVRYSLLDLLKLGKTPVRIDVYSPRARLMRDEKGKLGLSPEFPPAQKPGKKIPLPRFAFTLHGGRVSWQDRLGKPFGAGLENLEGKGTLIDERAAFELSGKENKKNKEGTADLRLRGEVLLDQGRGNLDGTLSGASFKKWTDYLASSRDWQALEGSFDLGVGVKWSKSAFSLKGWTRLREGKLGLTAIKAPVEKVSGFARFDSKEVSIEGVTGLVAGNRILAKGKVLSIDKVPRLALSLEIPAVQLESMEKLLPEVGLFKLKGRGSVTARAFGLALDPRVEGKVAIPLGEAYGEDLRSVVGNFSFHRNKVSLTGINGAWDGGRVEASGFFTTETQPEVKIEGSWREVNLAVAMAPYFKGMKGASSGVLSVHGPANDLLVEGRATADGSILDLETKKGSFLFKVWPKRWMVSEASALVEGALLQGEASGLLTGAVSGKFSAELPFQRLKKFGLEAEGRGKIKGNFRGDSNEADSWEGAGFFDAASSSFEKQPIEEASSAWSFKKDRLFIRDAVIGLGGGRLSGSGELLLAKQPSATGKLRLEGVELAQVPLAQDLEALGRVSGKTSAEMSVSWLSGVLRAKGKVEGRNLAFSKVGKIERVAGPLYWGHQVLTT